MGNQYTVSIKNKSGAFQNYAIFSEPPKVVGKVSGTLWSNVFATAKTPDDSQANFNIYSQYYAVVGTSSGTPAAGVTVNVSGSRDVDLGRTDDRGNLVPGTTLNLMVEDDSPTYAKKEADKGGLGGAFQVITSTEFTIPKAVNNNWVIGLGGSKTGNSNDGPAATFTPQPGVKYQIQPSNKYYVAYGDFTTTALIDVQKMGTDVVAINFSEGTPRASIVHTAEGKLVLQDQ